MRGDSPRHIGTGGVVACHRIPNTDRRFQCAAHSSCTSARGVGPDAAGSAGGSSISRQGRAHGSPRSRNCWRSSRRFSMRRRPRLRRGRTPLREPIRRRRLPERSIPVPGAGSLPPPPRPLKRGGARTRKPERCDAVERASLCGNSRVCASAAFPCAANRRPRLVAARRSASCVTPRSPRSTRAPIRSS